MDRVARKLDAGENVESIRGYLYGVAKRVMLESVKERGLEREARESSRPAPADDAGDPSEARIDCLRRCLRRLPAQERTLIRAYYAGQASRRRLAEALCISYTTLKTRAHRIRSRLGECLQDCLKALGDR
jgi:RNA polymerase sigma factor (sigma-70 family)